MNIVMRLIACAWLTAATLPALAGEPWQQALSRMPLGVPQGGMIELKRTNCVPLMLDAFQPNGVVKALIFMPGATDELYFFRRAHATLTNANPSLLDAVTALTNQTHIQATFQPPLLLLHTTEDSLDVIADRQKQIHGGEIASTACARSRATRRRGLGRSAKGAERKIGRRPAPV